MYFYHHALSLSRTVEGADNESVYTSNMQDY